MIYNDAALSNLQTNKDVFEPYFGEKMRRLDDNRPAVSYGLSQAGYDIRLSPEKFVVFSPAMEQEVFLCPKLADRLEPVSATLQHCDEGSFFWLPPHCTGLGSSVELFNMPNHTIAFGFGKSTYARLGVIANITPIEPGWCGHLTISIVNPTPLHVRLWANEGIAQIVFADCGIVEKPYEGAYQNQTNGPTLSSVG